MSAQPSRKKRPAKKTTASTHKKGADGRDQGRGSRTKGTARPDAIGTRKKRPTTKRPVKKRPAKRSTRSAKSATPQEGERLQKVLAAAGFGSRRQCEELITTGRVEVDRKVVTELGTRVDRASHEIRLDGFALSNQKKVYYAVNKPQGVVSTNSDPAGRSRVIDLIPPSDTRLFAVGRLDINSEGLILVTNDGELANQLTHPRYGIEKTYRVQVAGKPDQEVLAQLRKGVYLAEGFARVENVTIKSRHKDSTILEMVLREGRNREIRRLLAKVGHKVLRLTRIAVGPVRLAKMAPGETRHLTRTELTALRNAAAAGPKPKSSTPARKSTTKKHTTKRLETKSPVTKKRSTKGPTTREPAAGGRTTKRSTTTSSTTKKRPTKKYATKGLATKGPATKKRPIKKRPAKKHAAKKKKSPRKR